MVQTTKHPEGRSQDQREAEATNKTEPSEMFETLVENVVERRAEPGSEVFQLIFPIGKDSFGVC